MKRSMANTVDGTCDGVYRMDDRTFARDRTLKVWVALQAERVDELRCLASKIAAILQQESLYFEVTDAEVEFVRPTLGVGENQ